MGVNSLEMLSTCLDSDHLMLVAIIALSSCKQIMQEHTKK